MCEKKATMVVRLNQAGEVVLEGEKIVIGGNEIYKTLCRKHFRKHNNTLTKTYYPPAPHKRTRARRARSAPGPPSPSRPE